MKPQRIITTSAHRPFRAVALNAFFLGLLLAFLLHYAEQAYPIRPRWIFLEVVVGVVFALTPVALAARRWKISDWSVYERLVYVGFVAEGLPIIIWQLVAYWPK
ncbi:hypothetical protein K2Z83_15660 [Oscillochloris sp. ZM17-4]|uniref:hypothetical protein n=1 Tax=Oscillochloris sp. ZM17-4 TaxID=2866714 RepID=UPI001C72C170|nr:hypothetical protein [Oscillochloris sp. ZM17-4]MBX0329114.1 hypothetical protein [Oscillochloris sp. ZM17-4]